MKKQKYEIVEGKFCGNCDHYKQHYIKWGKHSYYALLTGHCTYPRIKKREPTQTCQYYTPKE